MKLLESEKGVILELYVKPNSKRFSVQFEGEKLVVSCREAPVKGRVNKELIKKLSKLFNRKVELVSGSRSRNKKILISNVKADEVNQILDSASAEDVP